MAVTNAHSYWRQSFWSRWGSECRLPGYTVLHVLAKVRKPGVGDNNPAPDGSGSMSSLELVRDLAAPWRGLERGDDGAA